jgi:putative transposase
MERLGSPRVHPGGRHEIEAMLYGDMNPVRAGMVRRPREWPWSSHSHYALGTPDPVVTDSPAYVALGKTGVERRIAYLRLLRGRVAQRLKRHRPELVVRPFFGPPRWVVALLREIEGVPAG